MIERHKVTLLVTLAAIFAVSRFASHIGPYYYQIILFAGINVILATSLNLVNGYTGQFSLGHAGFMSVGAYAAAMFTNNESVGVLSALKPLGTFASISILFGVALLLGGLAAAVTGLLVGIPSLRLKGDYLAIVTLGFGEIIKVVIENVDALGGARGLSVSAGYTNLFWVFATAAITIYVVLNLVNSTYGRGFLTVRDDEIAAEAMGINTTKYKVLAFTLAAFFAGIAGGLYAHLTQFINPEGFNFLKSVDIVTMVILGGMGSTGGVVFAAIVLTILPEWLRWLSERPYLPHWLGGLLENRMIPYSLLLILLMLLRPQGIFGGLHMNRKRA
ncbi:MAG TPA: branched-chain amino acid ABC transporter permease [Chthoniobacteraceae bacterium]|jgi:branched-chain amino acid transport system permease protein|nr:branched-chain amino acid ABC transporter permease [Chthoniobacteraceae bacterium]